MEIYDPKHPDMPIVLCRRTYSSQDPKHTVEIWKFWCPFCARFHHHGAGEGHRSAHCADPEPGKSMSPFRNTGYIIKLDEKLDELLRKLGV